VAEYFYCSIGALLFSAYIVFDTYMICNRLSQEEYILGAIDLYACQDAAGWWPCNGQMLTSPRDTALHFDRRRYLDIINLFLMILRILGNASD